MKTLNQILANTETDSYILGKEISKLFPYAELEGSEKQINWALSIRHTAASNLEADMIRFELAIMRADSTEKSEKYYARYTRIAEDLKKLTQETKASEIISNYR
jgi:single-stranded DNA-specific DHH superfamily exonuclease